MSGLHELTHSLEREEARLGLRHDSEGLDPAAARSLQTAWERAEWAGAELANESPHSNAQALISMNSALDAMVEDLVKFWRSFQVNQIVEDVIEKGTAVEAEAAAKLTQSERDAVHGAVRAEIEKLVPKSLIPKGTGIARYEKPLRRIGLGAPRDRPIPSDLDLALTELGALRHVLVHRAGRIDEKALADAPSLKYCEGQFIRISRLDYRTHSAAVRCYASEIGFRGIRNWPEVSDEKDGPHLEQWRDYVMVNA